MNRRLSVASKESSLPFEAGLVTVLDWKGHRAAVTYTFDDSNASQVRQFERLSALNVPFSFYLWTEKEESKDPIWARAVREGHELGNHSHSHRESGSGIARDIDVATEFIQDQFQTAVWTMAAPYGSSAYLSVAESRFLVNRGVNDGLMLPRDDTNPFDLHCYVPPAEASRAAYERKVDAARAAGGWQVILIHGFSGGGDEAYQAVDLDEFVASVEKAKSYEDVWIGTLVDVGAYWLGQKAFEDSRVRKRGNAVTFSWELPVRFPPDRSLLVACEGQLSQHGKPVFQNSAGHHEISLDARSLTVIVD